MQLIAGLLFKLAVYIFEMIQELAIWFLDSGRIAFFAKAVAYVTIYFGRLEARPNVLRTD
jgi:hypothetical protein